MDGFKTLGTGRPTEQSGRIVFEVFAAVRVVTFPSRYERNNVAGPHCVLGQGALQVARFQFLRFVDGVRHASRILSGGGRTD